MTGPDWVVYGSGTWLGTSYTEHNLARALARRHAVLYVDPAMSPLTPLRDEATTWRDVTARRPRRDHGVGFVRPLALPPLAHARARAWSLPWLRAQIAAARRRSGIERPVVLNASYRPGLRGAAGEVLLVTLVHDWVPAGAALLGRREDDLLADVDAVCAEADLVVCISAALRETLAARGHRARLLRHGFSAELAPDYAEALCPADLAELPRPRLGYTGTIDARLAFGALAELAERFDHGSLVLVGPVSPRLDRALIAPLAARANVHLTGPRGREAMPHYQANLDCLLMPYVEDEWGRHGSPLKLWEYLFAGPPLAGSGYTALRELPPPLVHFASPPERLAETVATALAEDVGGSEARRRHALANTWDHRAEELDALVAGELAERHRAASAL